MLSDSVKMIAYRAETAFVTLLRRHLNKEEEARALIRELFVSSGDILPDDVAKTQRYIDPDGRQAKGIEIN